MGQKKDQHNVGTPSKPRGQEMGLAGTPDQNRSEMDKTPALRGRRKEHNKMFGDVSQQHVNSDATKLKSNSPSTIVMNTKPSREGGGAAQFKKRLAKKRANQK
jgi:hypothetical protein